MMTCSLVIFSGTAISQSTPRISIKYDYYSIHGSIAAQLRSQMNQLGYLDKSTGRHYDAYTRWYVKWN